MADLLDQIQARDTAELNAQLALADHDNSWSQTFYAPRSPEALRAGRNYDELLATAMERKAQLERSQAPVKDQLTLAQIEHQNAMTARDNFKVIEDQRLSRQAGDLYSGLTQLKTEHEPDSPEYRSGLLDLIHKNHEAARRDPGIQEELKMTAQTMADKSYWTRFNQAHRAALMLAKTRGVDVQFDSEGNPSIEATQAYADSLGKGETNTAKPGAKNAVEQELFTHHKITPTEFLSPDTTVLYGSVEGTGKKAKFIPDADGKTGGKIALIDTGEGKPPVRMQASEYARYKEALSQKVDMPTSSAAAATPPTVDLKSVAQKALDDPNASEAHKAAARKILGQ